MATQIGPKIGVDGEAEYRQQMARINSEAKALKAEMTELATAVTDESTAQENAKKQAENYTRQLENQEERVRLLSEQLDRATEAYGEGSTQANEYRAMLANARTTLNQMRTEQSGATEDVNDFADAEEEAGEKAVSMGDLIKANVISDAIMAGLKKLAELGREAAQALWGTVTGAAEYADTYLTMSQTTGLSTDQLQEFAYMAELVDVSLDTMTGSMTKLTRQMSAARSGNEAAGEAFARLGIKTTNADGSLRDSTEVFFEVIDALGQMEDGSERDALAMEIFGKSAQQLNPLIAQGRAGIEGFAEEAREMGYVLDEETLSKLGELDDSFQRLTNLRTMISNKLGAGMAPGVTRAVDKLIEFGERVDWDRVGNALGNLVETGVDKLIELADGADLDRLADGALKLGEGIVTGGTWILEHADEIIKLVSTIGGAMLLGKGAGAAKSAWDTVSGLFGGAEAATGAAAAAAPAAVAETGAEVGAAMGEAAAPTFWGAIASGAGWASALALPLSILGFGAYGAYANTQMKNEAVAEAIEEAAAYENASLEELRSAEQALFAEYRAAEQAADQRDEMETWAALGGIDPEDGYRSAEFEAAAAAAKAKWKAVRDMLAEAEAGLSDESGLTLIDAGDVSDYQASWDAIAAAASESLDGITADAQASGEDAMASYADGITLGADKWLAPALATTAGLFASYFHHSEPDVGPMADDADWMPDMMAGWARQINDNSYLVRDAMAGLAFDLQDVLRPGLQAGGGGVNYGGVSVVIYGADGQSASDLYEEFSYRLNQDVLDREAVFA